jgi:hypothetical protein
MSVEDILSGAKKAVAEAEERFPSSQAPVHEYSNAPYHLAKSASSEKHAPSTGLKKEAEDTAAGINWKFKQAEALKK